MSSPPPPAAPPASTEALQPPPPVSPVLTVDRVSKWFGDVVAVSDVSFQVWPGVTALLGPNGAGKSTLLRMIAGLAAPSQGTIQVFGEDPRSDRETRGRIGIVPQQETLFQEQRAIDFVTLAGVLNRVDDPVGQARR